MSKGRTPILQMLRGMTPARMKKKLKMEAMPKLRLWNNSLLRSVVGHLFLLVDPTLLRPTHRLPQLHLPADLLLLRHPKLFKHLSFIRSLECGVQL
jgi:hypothetical protein